MIPNGWIKTTVSAVAEVVTGTTPSTSDQNNFNGSIPFVSPGDLGGRKYIDTASKYLSEKGASKARLIPSGSTLFTCIGSTIGKTGMAGRALTTNQQINAAVPKDISEEYLYYALCHIAEHVKRIAGVQAVPLINKSEFEQQIILMPLTKSLQNKIASILSTWDLAIEKAGRLIDAKQLRLRAFRERYLQNTQHSNRIKLQSVTRESTERNGARLGREAIMAVTKLAGMRPMKEETIAACIDRYKVVKRQAFAYNPMRLNIGSIAMSPFNKDVLVSPDYVVFECDESKLLPGYLNHLRFSLHWRNYFESAGSGSVRVRIYYDDLAAFTFGLPPVEMQRRIVNVLDALVLEIDLLKQQADALRQQKRGLMQKLLTGAWTVKPEREPGNG